MKSASEVAALVNNVRGAHGNTIFAQVRRRGDAFYKSSFEPHVAGTSPADFDALADLISKAHNTNSGPYVEVHAWIVTYHIWSGLTNAASPPQPDHPLRLHPDWLLQDVNGNVFIGNQYTFDPGHPEVQRHTFNVCMDIIANYNVDGLNFDYIRYSGINDGYNPVAVERFNRRFGRAGLPAPADPVWKQFRRDQITGLLRKVYLYAIDLRPEIKISCDTITWAPGPANAAAWYSSSAAWNSVLQDWRGWMEEGIMDLNLPMAYFDQSGAYAASWTNWNNFAKDHQYNRQAAIGPGTYLNSLADAITQMRFTRTASLAGNRPVGLCSYSYHVPYESGAGQFSSFRQYLTNSPNLYDSSASPLFAVPVPVPDMPWKKAPVKGHLKGVVLGGSVSNLLDGAVVRITGSSATRTQTNDATGFFGFVDLPPGNYSVIATFPSFEPRTNTVAIIPGKVTTSDLLLPPLAAPTIISNPQDLSVIEGQEAGFSVTSAGSAPLQYQWRFQGTNLAGATSSTFTRRIAEAAHHGDYSVIVANQVGHATSEVARLTVLLPPRIDLAPLDQIVTRGAPVDFSVEISGSSPLIYQWVFNGIDIPSATNRVYHIDRVQEPQAGLYQVRVSNAAGQAETAAARLIVTLPPPAILQPIRFLANGWGLLSWTGQTGLLYAVQGSTNLSFWEDLGAISNSGSLYEYLFDTRTNGAVRFYRVRD